MGTGFFPVRTRPLTVATLLTVYATSGCGGKTIDDSGMTAQRGTGGTAGVGIPGIDGHAGSAGACSGAGGPMMVRLPEGYCIDSTEVTRGQYQAWVATNPPTSGQPARCTWKTNFVPEETECMTSTYVYHGSGFEDHPQVCVDWCDAYAYCQGVGKRLCGKIGGGPGSFDDYANPSSSQWHNACVSGAANNAYPYGNTYQPTVCAGYDYDPTITVPTASLPDCQSPVPGYAGIYDLSGNVWEWEDGCGGPGGTDLCRLRGGSFGWKSPYLRCDGVLYDKVSYATSGIGFRCCSP